MMKNGKKLAQKFKMVYGCNKDKIRKIIIIIDMSEENFQIISHKGECIIRNNIRKHNLVYTIKL